MKLYSLSKIAVAFVIGVSSAFSWAAVSADEAKQLGAKLTAFGAEAGANADGTIPAYTGGAKAPADFKAGVNVRPSPYANDKPRLVIKGADADKQGDKLTVGTRELLKRYPDSFRVDVYPTQRSVTYPKIFLDNTLKNAVNAKTSPDGLVLENARAGVPFPIPKNGYEVMWNHLTRYTGTSFTLRYDSWNMDSAGNAVLATTGEITQEYPIFDAKNADRVLEGTDIFFQTKVAYLAPARRVGEALIVKDALNPLANKRRAWQYLPGQRRVKEAPELAYDTPNPGSAGMSTYDDAFMFNGAMDRYDFKLIGKKEMIVPYNNYAWSYQSTRENFLLPRHLNPDLLRWELRRVYVVEANLKEGKRHIYTKRTFYVEEDSWTVVAAESYDARGNLFRANFMSVSPAYDVQAPNSVGQVFYDFIANSYSVSGINTGKYGGIRFHNVLSPNDWSPDSLSGSGIR